MRIQRTAAHFFALRATHLTAYLVNDPSPGRAAWELDLVNASFCESDGNASASAGASSSAVQSVGYELLQIAVVDEARLLLYCGPNMVLINTSNGNVTATHRFAHGDWVAQYASASVNEIVVNLTPSGRVVIIDLLTFRERWWRSGNALNPPIIGGAAGTAVIVDFFKDFAGAVQGFDARTGRLRWNVSLHMWAKEIVASLPLFSNTIFAWYGPDFALVRTVYFPTGAYWQYVPAFTIQLMYPTNDGRLLVASMSTIVALSVVNQTVLWERSVPIPLDFLRLSDDGAFVIVEADGLQGLPTLVYSMRDGSLIGSCGNVHCADPCAVGVASLQVAVMAECVVNTTATLRVVDPTSGAFVSAAAPLPTANHFNRTDLEPIGRDLIAAVDHTIRLFRVSVTTPNPSPTTAVPSSTQPDGAATTRDGSASTVMKISAAVGTTVLVAALSATLALRYWRRSRAWTRQSSHTVTEVDGNLRAAMNT